MKKDITQEKKELKTLLANELPVLRAKMRLTQESLVNAVGISRQTYTALETKRREMTWNVFVLLYLFFERHEESMTIMRTMGDFVSRTQELLKTDEAVYTSTNKNGGGL